MAGSSQILSNSPFINDTTIRHYVALTNNLFLSKGHITEQSFPRGPHNRLYKEQSNYYLLLVVRTLELLLNKSHMEYLKN
jgi:hypothetical protein